VRSLLPALRKVLAWIDRYGDRDGDGFLEYRTRSPVGVKHQGWKDSDDAVVMGDGSNVDPPVAACEIQGYWYAGLQLAALACFFCGERVLAGRLLWRARRLKERFNRRFWLEREQFVPMGLDASGRPIDAVSSNPGPLLITGVLPGDRGRLVARRLLQPEMFSGWGVRTLASDNPFYNPFSYHRGSVWPVEQGTIAFGLARYGCWEELHRLAEGVFALSELFVGNRLPEVVSGLPRDDQHPHPGIYPYSCEPQGWSASAVVMVVQALLGLHPVAPLRTLFVDPHLPPWLPELSLEGVRVGHALVDLHCRRTAAGKTACRVVHREGRVLVLRQPPPNAGLLLGRRLRGLLPA
ncbi:MAG: amylo-alpha-1,6-glucosidase, partial [Dehalococcoidia bacterium]|nr:amylo-alpha-1,6-glucosidase [Dehalococcoidia bacterium]